MDTRTIKRDSIFSNDSINGFHSALFFSSEFEAENSLEAFIPVNDFYSSNASKELLSLSNFHTKSQTESPVRYLNYKDQESEPASFTYYSDRRFSTPVNHFYHQYDQQMDKEKKEFTMNTMVYHNLIRSKLNNINSLCSSNSPEAKLIIFNQPTNIAYRNGSDAITNTLNSNVGLSKRSSANAGLNNISNYNSNNTLSTSASTSNKQNKKRIKQERREGDWICLNCQNLNFAFRHECNKCSLIRQNNVYKVNENR